MQGNTSSDNCNLNVNRGPTSEMLVISKSFFRYSQSAEELEQSNPCNLIKWDSFNGQNKMLF